MRHQHDVKPLPTPNLHIDIDRDPNRLAGAKKLGADYVVDTTEASAEEAVVGLTGGVGCDTVMEAVGVPKTLELAQDLVAAGGVIANIGVHGKSCTLNIEKLWVQKIALTRRLVDTVTAPMLLTLFVAGSLYPGDLITQGQFGR